MMTIAYAMAMIAGQAAAQPVVFTKVRDDGVEVYCIRTEKPVSIVSARTRCDTVAGWRRRLRSNPDTFLIGPTPMQPWNETGFRGSTVLGPR